MAKVAVIVACAFGLACGQVLPPGLSEPLTKMAERMTRAHGGFLRTDPVTLHIAERTVHLLFVHLSGSVFSTIYI